MMVMIGILLSANVNAWWLTFHCNSDCTGNIGFRAEGNTTLDCKHITSSCSQHSVKVEALYDGVGGEQYAYFYDALNCPNPADITVDGGEDRCVNVNRHQYSMKIVQIAFGKRDSIVGELHGNVTSEFLAGRNETLAQFRDFIGSNNVTEVPEIVDSNDSQTVRLTTLGI